MTTTTPHNGRLGNQIIRNLAVSRIAEKHNLFVNYSSHNIIQQLGIPLYCGKHTYYKTIVMNDANYFDILNMPNLSSNLDPNSAYFQTKDITNMLYKYLRENAVKLLIMERNPFNQRYNANNDIFIHLRLTDAARFNPGVNYYINAIQSIQADNIYMATDEIGHPIAQQILSKFPNIQIMQGSEAQTMQFGSTCRNIILSHGSFSAVIGYLAYFSLVHYPEYMPDKIWHGDMFSIDGWIQHSV